MASSTVEICDLPDEVLCYIFSKLHVKHVIKCVMNVCQRWRFVVAENKIFWDNVQLVVDCDGFFGQSYLDKDTTITMIPINTNRKMPDGKWVKEIFFGENDLEKVPKLQRIKFAEGCKSLDRSVSKLMAALSKTCKDIEKVEFSLSFGSITSSVISSLRESYNNIKEIWLYGSGSNPLHRVPYNEISRFTNLNTLVSHATKFRSSDLYLLAEECEHLNSLWLLLCLFLEIDDVLYFIEKKKNTLKELGLGVILEDRLLNKLKECHNLEVFFASHAGNVTDTCVKSFASQSSVKYCSLQQAELHPATINDIAGPSRKPGTFKHLKLLDLTGYYHYTTIWFRYLKGSDDDWSESHSLSFMMGSVVITFNNPVQQSIDNYCFSPGTHQDHWMYRYRK